jgi:hypothetical protein
LCRFINGLIAWFSVPVDGRATPGSPSGGGHDEKPKGGRCGATSKS